MIKMRLSGPLRRGVASATAGNDMPQTPKYNTASISKKNRPVKIAFLPPFRTG